MPKTLIAILFALTFFVFSYEPASAKNVGEDLPFADSLFQARKYTEAFAIYERILGEGTYSPAMVLRMAFIKEGLSDYTNALYYLHLYFKLTSNIKVWSKIEELAETHKLQGYVYSDMDYFYALFDRYKLQLIGLIAAFSFLFFGLIIRRKLQGRKPTNLGISFVFCVGLLFYLVNFDFVPKNGITKTNHIYLMSAPSAASELVEIISKGHKVRLLEAGEVWAKISWNDESAYVRSNQLKELI